MQIHTNVMEKMNGNDKIAKMRNDDKKEEKKNQQSQSP